MTAHHATGTFTVTVTPEPGDAPYARMALAKAFHGGLEGTARGVMLASGRPGGGIGAAYVALDTVTGTLDGRAGGFLLIHRGTMTKDGAADLAVIVAPDTGTGALAGIAGTLTITVKDGVHHYELDYTLP